MQNIYGITYQDLENYFIENNEKKYRAKQVYDFLYKKRVKSFEEMTNINNELREKLITDFDFSFIKIINKYSGDEASKYLFELSDGNTVEAVVMYHDYGISICVSSEVGCNMGCRFCESGRLKKVRDLDSYEMVLQILMIEEDIKKRITHVVIMGIGEPFDNYDNVSNFISIINDNNGIEIGIRHITVSTCGLIPGIKRFMKEKSGVNLAISLHAPSDVIRNKIMPINKVYNISKLIPTIKEYISITNRRVTFEYVLLANINDTDECAIELANLLRGINCYVNLIPYNETDNIAYKRSKKEQIMKFYDILKKRKINVTIRREFGGSFGAACGQLRANQMLKMEE